MKYTQEDYDTLISQSYSYSSEEHRTSTGFKIIKRLYEDNYIGVPDDLPNKIPHKIHQIWLGGDFPDKFKKYSESWQRFHPDWEYKLWTEKDLPFFAMINRDAFEVSNSVGQKSDIWRYEILRRHGGIYVDTDFECLKPFDDLMYLDFFTSSGYTTRVELYIGLIACTPFHDIIDACVLNMGGVHGKNSVMDVFYTTGSYFFTQRFFMEVKDYMQGVVAFPMGFFYPLPNNIRQAPNHYDYVKPYSYALHHWDVSWLDKKKK